MIKRNKKDKSDFKVGKGLKKGDGWQVKQAWLESNNKRKSKNPKVYSVQNVVLMRTKTGYKLTLDSSRKLNNKEIREAITAVVHMI